MYLVFEICLLLSVDIGICSCLLRLAVYFSLWKLDTMDRSWSELEFVVDIKIHIYEE